MTWLPPLPPSLTIHVEIEAVAPTVLINASSYEDEVALKAWISRHPEILSSVCCDDIEALIGVNRDEG